VPPNLEYCFNVMTTAKSVRMWRKTTETIIFVFLTHLIPGNLGERRHGERSKAHARTHKYRN